MEIASRIVIPDCLDESTVYIYININIQSKTSSLPFFNLIILSSAVDECAARHRILAEHFAGQGEGAVAP